MWDQVFNLNITKLREYFFSPVSVFDARSKLSDFIQNIFVCVSNMNEGLTGLERHEGSFLGELSL